MRATHADSDIALRTLVSRWLAEAWPFERPAHIGRDLTFAEWTALPDLCAFVEKNIFEAATRAVFGPHLVELNPNISVDFWNFKRRPDCSMIPAPSTPADHAMSRLGKV